MVMYRKNIVLRKTETVEWLAKEIFGAFPGLVSGLKFHLLDCGCIYYQRVFRDGVLDPNIAVYRDAGYGTCDICTMKAVHWRQMVRDVVVVYNVKMEMEMHGAS
jgi:hypothetical protein